ncbi:MAG TPA: hypothetical protein VK714_08420 [Myxococcota bacterium]|nr:hypothetical protein [Myxococcota bacterium]
MRTKRLWKDNGGSATTPGSAGWWSGRLWTAERIRKVALTATLGAVVFFAPRPVAAADSAPAEPDWEAKIYAFGWFPAVYSNPQIGDFTAHINIKTEDLLRRFRWGGGAGLEDRYKDFLLLADGMAAQFAMPLGGPVQQFSVNPLGGALGGGVITTGPSNIGERMTIMMLEGALGWRALSIPMSSASTDDPRRFHLDLLAGARLWYLRNKLSVSIPPARLFVGGVMIPPGSVTLPPEVTVGRTRVPGILARDGINTEAETTTSWVDAVIGFRASVDVVRTVSLTFRGDVGGFSIGNSSNFTWQAMPGVEWRFTDHWFANVAYQAIGFDKGRASSTILYGVNIGVGYRF